MKKVEVLIVGAGPVGLTLGTLLGQSGIDCLVIDKTEDWPHESRAITMTARTLEHLQIIDMAKPMVEAGIPCKRISYYFKNHYLGRADFNSLQSPWNFVLQISQYTITKRLAEAMAKTQTKLQRPVEYLSHQSSENGIECLVRNGLNDKEETIEAQFLIACDGGRSRVREMQGMPFPGEIQGETFLMTDVVLENFPYPSDERHYIFLPQGRGILAVLPLLDEDNSQIFRIISILKETKSFDKQQILKILETAFHHAGMRQVKFVKEIWTTYFNPKQFVVPEFYRDHIAYAGDAAHIQSPIGAQGLNTGIQDAFNLAWRLVFVLSHGAPESMLHQYHKERHKTALNLFNYNNRQRQRMIKSGPILKALMLLSKKLNVIPSINKKEIDLVSQLPLNYAEEAEQSHAPACLQAGYRFPIHLFDDKTYQAYESYYEANRFLCVFWDNGESCSEFIQNIQQNYPQIKLMVLSQNLDSLDLVKLIPDKNRALHKAMHIKEQTLCLIRPDTYIAVTAAGNDCLEVLQSYWKSLGLSFYPGT